MIVATVIAGFGVAMCLASQAFFSGTEMAMVSADRATLRVRASDGHAGAQLALRLLEREDTLLGTCLIGTNLSVVAGTTLVATVVAWHDLGLGLLAAFLFTPFALILGENLPKTVFQYHANMLAPVLSWPLRGAQMVFTPALWVVGGWASLLARVTGSSPSVSVTRQEIVELLDVGGDTEILPQERDVIRRVFAISQSSIEECMTPLVHVTGVDAEMTLAEASGVAILAGHTRLPVHADRVDNIVGLLHVHTLLFADDPSQRVADAMSAVKFVPESKPIDDLLHEMRHDRDHLVAVVDEYGGTTGIITIEDLLEEVVGEIHDERDHDESLIQRIGEREWRMSARLEIEALQLAVAHPIPEGDYETVAGLILARAGKIPSRGSVVRVDGLTFLVEDASERAVTTVRLTLPWRAS